MKKRFVTLFILYALCGCFCGCSGIGSVPEAERAAVIFDIGFPPEGRTKAQTASETNITRLQVAIYGDGGNLEWENTYEYAFSSVKTISGLTEGRKTIVAVANKKVTMPSSLDEFHTIPVSLDDNRRDSFVMYGCESAEASVSPALTTIHLKRAVAKISVRSSISSVSEDGKTHEFVPERIYIANVATKTNLRGDAFEEFANLREDRELTGNQVIRDLTVAEKEYWVNGGVFNHGVDFYVCPNRSSERQTTMIIEAEFDGLKCYYPVVIASELLANTMYRCGVLTISCEGMPNPGDEFSSIRVQFNYGNDDWDEGKTAEKIIFE